MFLSDDRSLSGDNARAIAFLYHKKYTRLNLTWFYIEFVHLDPQWIQRGHISTTRGQVPKLMTTKGTLTHCMNATLSLIEVTMTVAIFAYCTSCRKLENICATHSCPRYVHVNYMYVFNVNYFHDIEEMLVGT